MTDTFTCDSWLPRDTSAIRDPIAYAGFPLDGSSNMYMRAQVIILSVNSFAIYGVSHDSTLHAVDRRPTSRWGLDIVSTVDGRTGLCELCFICRVPFATFHTQTLRRVVRDGHTGIHNGQVCRHSTCIWLPNRLTPEPGILDGSRKLLLVGTTVGPFRCTDS